jgi:hypothetical protein
MLPKGRLERASIALAFLCVIWLVLLNGKPAFTNASRPQRISDPQLALQFARNIGEVDAILGDSPSPDREVMRLKQFLDFGFIPTYAGFLCCISVFAFRQGGWARLCGIAATICILATAGFDVAENIGILRLLDVPLFRTTPAMINAIRQPSAAKWILAAASYFLAGLWLLRIRPSRLRAIAIAPLALAAAIVTMVMRYK